MSNPEKKYKFAVIAADVVIFSLINDELQALLIRMKKSPYAGYWAAPGGLVKPEESVDEAAKRHLFTKTGVKDVYLEQLYTFGEVARDPFGRVVSVAYFALIPTSGLKLKTTDEYEEVKWFAVSDLPKLAYDHRKIIEMAIKRLRSQLEYSNIVYSLMPAEFTLPELQKTYEIILKKNFIKEIFARRSYPLI
jgi:8-oxo-dGTP diphosphatase